MENCRKKMAQFTERNFFVGNNKAQYTEINCNYEQKILSVKN